MRRFNLILLAITLLIAIPIYWLLLDNRPGDIPPKPISIDQLRALAEQLPGAKPNDVEGEVAGYRSVPRDLFAAGAGLKREPIAVLAWRLRAADGSSVVIDSGITTKDAAAMGIEKLNPPGQARIERALREANLILFTHEHPDHQAAALRLAGGIPAAAKFNPGQLPPAALAARLPWPSGTLPQASLRSDAPFAVAPGVVVIPAPNSHTPGSQMIYVKTADGQELLFAGDIATLAFSWQDLRARSRLVSQFLAKENRDEVYAWLKTIRKWKAQAAGLKIFPGHDVGSLLPDKGHPPLARSPLTFPAPAKSAVRPMLQDQGNLE